MRWLFWLDAWLRLLNLSGWTLSKNARRRLATYADRDTVWCLVNMMIYHHLEPRFILSIVFIEISLGINDHIGPYSFFVLVLCFVMIPKNLERPTKRAYLSPPTYGWDGTTQTVLSLYCSTNCSCTIPWFSFFLVRFSSFDRVRVNRNNNNTKGHIDHGARLIAFSSQHHGFNKR